MLKNYIKIAFRNLLKNKLYSAINIFGLTIGLTTCFMILLFVQNQLSYDRFNEKADQIFRVAFVGQMNGGEIKEANVMPPVAQTLKDDFPEVLDAARIRSIGTPRISYNNQVFRNSTAFADPSLFDLFTIPLIKGDKQTILSKPNTLVLSQKAATQFFGDENPIGKTILIKDGNANFEVVGVYETIPGNSHFHFDVLASMATLPEATNPSWMVSNFYTYLLLPDGYDYKNLEAKLPQVVEKYMGPQLQEAMGITFSQFRESGNNIGFELQPLTDIHLHSKLSAELEAPGDIQYVYIFIAVALFMLLIACINFMNLSTAGASKRAKEIGVRKVLGSLKQQLILQFLIESLLLTSISLIIALSSVDLVLPYFNTLTQQELTFSFSLNHWIVPAMLGFVVITGVLAGSYPAFYLSSFNPVNIIKSRFFSDSKGFSLRSGLVVFQFFISIGMITSTLVVYKQLSFIQHKNLGYNKDQVVIVEDTYWLGESQNAFKEKLLTDSRVINASYSAYIPAGASNSNNFLIFPDENSANLVHTLRYGVDYNYIPTLDMQMVAGRNFSEEYGSDSLGIIINEAAANAFGWENPIGHQLTHTNNGGAPSTFHVIGVVQNFHFRSLHELITPLVMTLEGNQSHLIVKVRTDEPSNLLAEMKSTWDSFTAESPFTYSFLNDRFTNTYKTEQNIGLILGIFAGLTIFVACLGLFALVMFTTERRSKEIGIRKILGANAAGIIALLSKDFLKLVGIAFLLASPVAWFIMNQWLQNFVYRIQISGWIFLLTGVAALAIALLTISSQSIKTAMANPVNSLKNE